MRALYMQTPRDWNRDVSSGRSPRTDVLPHVFAHGGSRLIDEDVQKHVPPPNPLLLRSRDRGGCARGRVFRFHGRFPQVNFQWASAFFPPIFASTMTEQESPCSGCVT